MPTNAYQISYNDVGVQIVVAISYSEAEKKFHDYFNGNFNDKPYIREIKLLQSSHDIIV